MDVPARSTMSLSAARSNPASAKAAAAAARMASRTRVLGRCGTKKENPLFSFESAFRACQGRSLVTRCGRCSCGARSRFGRAPQRQTPSSAPAPRAAARPSAAGALAHVLAAVSRRSFHRCELRKQCKPGAVVGASTPTHDMIRRSTGKFHPHGSDAQAKAACPRGFPRRAARGGCRMIARPPSLVVFCSNDSAPHGGEGPPGRQQSPRRRARRRSRARSSRL